MHIEPKKSLGQNFLIDKNVQRKIIEACRFNLEDIVLEVGAGAGELTNLFIERVGSVFALEIDSRLCNVLAENLKGHKNIKIINQNILKFNLKRYFKPFAKKIKVVGNIPYYITTPILEHVFSIKDRIDSIFLTVQKEFGQRIVAKPGSKDYGAISCFIQYHTNPKILFYIKRRSFFPVPKVDSCLLHLEIKVQDRRIDCDEKRLFKIIRAAFNQRRKTLRNSLQGIVGESRLNAFLDKFNLDPNIRPEQLSIGDFMNLSRE